MFSAEEIAQLEAMAKQCSPPEEAAERAQLIERTHKETGGSDQPAKPNFTAE
jgi:hypothetical protein